ncbi:MAG: universal stress protein [Candidatus Brocadiae bacterium]|nr:universal stress protein [Candidatus Brocadiia bacterium]
MTPEPAPVFLVASDVSPLAHLALIHAGRLARVRGGSVVAIHVVEQMVLDDLEEALPNARDVRTSVLAGARKRVEESVAQAIPPGVDVRVDIRIASPGAGILDAAREAGAALIVMGAHGGEGGGPPGSIARRVANKAACDVLLVRGTVAEPFRHVVSCLDFSDISRRALARAAEIARADAARLTALHVFVPPWKVLHYRAPTDEANPAFEAAFLRGLEDELGAAIDGLGDALKGVAVEKRLGESMDVSDGIVEEINGLGADLAVVGATGRSALAAFLLGTTADRIIHDCPKSVLVVR